MAVTSGEQGTSYYSLRPRPPVRAWALAVVLTVGGVLAVVVGWPAPHLVPLLVFGGVLTAAGVVLGVVSTVFIASRALRVVLSDDGFEVNGPGYHKQGSWLDVDRVATTPDNARLVISQGHVDRTFIQAPGARPTPQMEALVADIAERLARATKR